MTSSSHSNTDADRADPTRTQSEDALDSDAAPCLGGDCGDAAMTAGARSSSIPSDVSRTRYRIEKMDCPTEEQLIRKRLSTIEQIAQLDFNLLDRELTVYHRLADTQALREALEAISMEPVQLDGNEPVSAAPPVLSNRERGLLAFSGLTALLAEIMAWTTDTEVSIPIAVAVTVSILSGGLPTLKKGWTALRNLTLNIHFLMSLAVTGAIAIGEWPEAAMVVFLFAVAEAIEALSLERARNAIKSLTSLTPEVAEVARDNSWLDTPVENVVIGARIRVRTGNRVPLDATVTSGFATLDQAPITGESLPIDKSSGDDLYAGTIVTDGVIEAVVTADARESTLARIATAIQEAQSQRAPSQRFVDRFARIYTPVVVVVALLVAILGPLVSAEPWTSWVYEALVLLVIACPCALVISTPVTVVSGLAAAAKHGILIKGGTYLEGGRSLKVLALDKTGTLTEGKPILTDAVSISDLSTEEALRVAASLDDASTHPVAEALTRGWREQQPAAELLPIRDFKVLTGRGVQGRINEELWYVGNHRLIEEIEQCSPALEKQLTELESVGKTAIVLCNASGPKALFGIADAVKPESEEAIADLKSLGITAVMLTGDNPTTAQAIAEALQIEDARGDLLPEDKQTAIVELKSAYGSVGMVGDGVNDAPALARADIGFAMGAAGTATALETADVAIMDDDPRKLADFVGLSRRTLSILRQNIALALGIKFVFVVLALMGYATLWMAVFADMGASLLVVFNGLRLLQHFNGHEHDRHNSADAAKARGIARSV